MADSLADACGILEGGDKGARLDPKRGLVSRTPLLALAALAILPMLVFGIAMVVHLDGRQRDEVEITLRQNARAAIQAVDRRLSDNMTALEALAAAPSLDGGDLASFEVHARRVLEAEPLWLSIRLVEAATLRPVLDLRDTVDANPTTGLEAAREIARVLETGRPLIGGIRRAASLGNAPVVVLRTPVARGGAARYVLSASVEAAALSEALTEQPIPQDWTLALIDRDHRIVGRTRAQEDFVATPATETLTREVERASESFFFSLNKEGERVYTAFSRSSFSGWTAAIGAPAALVEASIRTTLAASVAGGLAAAALALALVVALVRNTARRQAAERELAGERRLADVAANFPGVIFRRLLRPDGRLLYAYAGGQVGLLVGEAEPPAPDEPGAMDRFARMIHPEDAPRWHDAVARSAERLEPYRIEGRVVRPDGEIRWVRAAANVRREPDGTVVWDGVVLDVSDVKAAEAAQAENEARMRAIVEAAADGIVTIDERGLVEGFNPAAERMFGFRAEEIVGQDVRRLMPGGLEARAAGAAGAAVEIEGRRKDGGTFPMELSVGEAQVGDRRVFAGVVRDATERKRAEERSRLLIAELSHRVKNTLATVRSIVAQTLRTSATPEAFRDALDARLAALSHTHELLSRSEWRGASLRESVDAELGPHLGSGDPRVTLEGEDVLLGPRAALSIRMALHELATNAAKHGALSVATGRLSVTWDVLPREDGGTRLRLRWSESGGPSVRPPDRRGFGSRLIERGVAHELGGEARLEFDPSGVRCELDVPLTAR